jgi:stage II sporulation protein AA (anti-sigma F factor antagonist)
MLEATRTDTPKGLRIEGEVDLTTVEKFRTALAPLIREGGDVTLDVGEMRFIDSSGVQVIIGAITELSDRGRLLLLRPRPTVVRLVRVLGLQQFENFEVREEGSP